MHVTMIPVAVPNENSTRLFLLFIAMLPVKRRWERSYGEPPTFPVTVRDPGCHGERRRGRETVARSINLTMACGLTNHHYRLGPRSASEHET